MFSFPVPPSFATILHEINSLPDVPGVGIDALLPRKPFYLGCYVLSSTIRGDIRVLPTALVAHLFDEIRRQLRVNMRVCATSRSTLDGRAVHLGPEPRSTRARCIRWFSGRTHLTQCTPSHRQVPAASLGKWASAKRTFATGSDGSERDLQSDGQLAAGAGHSPAGSGQL